MNDKNSKKNPLKIVIASDTRFWLCQTGAQRRIHSMVRYLVENGCDVTTLFISPLADPLRNKTAGDELEIIRQQNLKVLSLLEHWHPQGTFARIVWKFKCIANWMANGLGNRKEEGPANKQVTGGRYLADFESPFFRERFQDMVRRLDPDAAIVEYITLGYLVPGDRDSGGPKYLVDTHDLLSERYRQFQKFGYEHWIRIGPDEEADVLRRFDTVIAIQPEEQAEFRRMIKDSREVIFAGHPSDTVNPVTVEETLAAPFTLGYFGSENASNVQAIEWFLEQVWPELRSANPAMSLLIAGTISKALPESVSQSPGITIQTQVADVDQLYRSFQIAINPVQFGTGLKIKNQEALAYGKPLVVTAQGFAGMQPPDEPGPIHVAEDAAAMKEAILQLASEDQIRTSVAAAHRYTRKYLSPDHVYKQLMDSLHDEAMTEHNCPERKIEAGV